MTQLSSQEAMQLVRQCLGAPYAERNLRQFAANLLPDAERLNDGVRVGAYVPERFRDHVVSYKRLAKMRSDEKLDVLAVKLKKGTSLFYARAMQRQFIAWYLNGSQGGSLKDAALAAFYAEDDPGWRFSFVYKDYVFEDGKPRTKLSEPRRSSFMVGADELSHTAAQQFVELLQDQDRHTIERIRDAFSVERVTREFFRQYRELYLELRNIIQNNIDADAEVKQAFPGGNAASIQAKRMLGQIVFLYFLQKKGWLGVAKGEKWGTGSHALLQKLFEANEGTGRDFFQELLNPLFYDALATDRTADDNVFALLGSRIPFLNGGLFEPLYDWKNIRLDVPGTFFSRLFEVFSRFNFTVREDEPLESEVAVDPEMLGKVFEGLLDVDERREKGTFYTPRHIVQYMCRESLVQYLDRAINFTTEYREERSLLPGVNGRAVQETLTGIMTPEKRIPVRRRQNILDIKDIRDFIRQDELVEADGRSNKKYSQEYTPEGRNLPEAIKKHAWSLDKALADVKICDPAIGSGAFPVGIMHEIVRARQQLREAAPEQFQHEPVRLTPYELKRNAIANSLYGVDLDPSAVDIAKLRLWLSLVVDENDFDKIKPLPNLDYKIMVGNSLDAANSRQDSNPLLYREKCSNIIRLQRKFLNITEHDKKAELRAQIAELRSECGLVGNFDWYIDFADVAEKFDILIGNPPYIQIQGMDRNVKALKPYYKTFESTGDIYCLFYELAFKLLKPHGVLTFITSNKWMRAAYGKKLRDFFLNNTRLIRVIDFAGNKVFDSATVDVGIVVLEKAKRDSEISACAIKEKCLNNLSGYIEQHAVFTSFEAGESWAVLSPIEQSIKRKIEAAGKPLKEWDVRINYGIKTGCNEAFIINGVKKAELIAQDPRSAEIIRPKSFSLRLQPQLQRASTGRKKAVEPKRFNGLESAI